MARLAHAGFETGHPLGEGAGIGYGLNGGAVFDTAQKRTGASALKIPSASGASYMTYGDHQISSTSGRNYYTQLGFYVAAGTITNPAYLMWIWSQSGTDKIRFWLDTSGVLTMMITKTNVDGSPISLGVTPDRAAWHTLEVRHLMTATAGANDQIEVVLNNSPIYVDNAVAISDSASMGDIYIGGNGTASGVDVWLDDFVVNDDQGSAENTWVGGQKVDVLFPTAESAVAASFLKPGGATTNRHTSIDNIPPTGLAHSTSAGDAEKQIYNITSTTTANADFTMETYLAAGLGPNDTIKVVQSFGLSGVNSATARAGALQTTANPAQGSEDSVTNVGAGAAAGAFPSNWKVSAGAMQYAPAVVKGTAPVLRWGKRAASTNATLLTQLGMYVTYSQAIPEVGMANKIT